MFSEDEEGINVTDPAEAASNEGVVCHEEEKRGEKVVPKPTDAGEENGFEDDAEAGDELC